MISKTKVGENRNQNNQNYASLESFKFEVKIPPKFFNSSTVPKLQPVYEPLYQSF